jgi:hypothetical protein
MFVSGSGSVLDDSYQVSFHVAKRFQRRRFLEIGHPEKIAMAAIFLANRDEMGKLYRGPSI